jgi:hypothetical protein
MEQSNYQKEGVSLDVNPIDDKVRSMIASALNFASVPKETSQNHVLVGGVGSVPSVDYSYRFYNPHNARFYFDWDSWNFKPTLGFRTVNSSEKVLSEYFGCRIVVKKSQIEITNLLDKDRRFKIDGSVDNMRSQVVDAVCVLLNEVIVVLKRFISEFGGCSSCVLLKYWIPDNKILHDKVIDSIPLQVTFRNDVVKKVYNSVPSNVEVSDPANASNMFRNLALWDFAPDIASRLDLLERQFVEFESRALVPLTEQIKTHLEVQHSTLALQKAMSSTLNDISCSLRVKSEGLLTSPLYSSDLPTCSRDSDLESIKRKLRLDFARKHSGFGQSIWGDE